MPTRTSDKNNTLLVKFYDEADDKTVKGILATMGISGTRVSTLIRRWAVEVPYWREEEFLYKFYDNELVQAIHESFDKEKEEKDGETNEN